MMECVFEIPLEYGLLQEIIKFFTNNGFAHDHSLN